MTTPLLDDAPLANGTPRWFAHPWLSAVIAASWLLLQGSLAPANLLWAVLLGLVLPRLAHDFIGPGSRPRSARAAARLAVRVLWDILVANVTVARLVLDPRRDPRPLWVTVAYTLEDPRAVALLATIVTNTPGTVSCVIDQERRHILVHALDATDAQALAEEIRQRYEQPLKEIFG